MWHEHQKLIGTCVAAEGYSITVLRLLIIAKVNVTGRKS